MPIVLITADDCPACVGFKKANLKDLVSETKKAGIKLIHVDLAKRSHLSMRDSSVKTATGFNDISSQYGIPTNFLTMIAYFPTLAQFTNDGRIYNLTGEIEGNRFSFAPKGNISDIVKVAIGNEKESKPKSSKRSTRTQEQPKPSAPEKIPDVQRRVMDDGSVVNTPKMIYRMYNSRSVVKL